MCNILNILYITGKYTTRIYFLSTYNTCNFVLPTNYILNFEQSEECIDLIMMCYFISVHIFSN